jgi:hypothetical protein
MKHKLGTLIVAKAKSSNTIAFAVITETYPDTKEYTITFITHNKDGSEWNAGTWDERMLEVWEKEYGYTFVK